MSARAAALIACISATAVSVHALQLTLDRRAIEEAIYIGQSRIELERARFHAPYRVRVSQSPVDWIDVVTPFHRVALAAEANARAGGRQFSQREARDILQDAPNQVDLIVEMSFHPLNTFVAVPAYDVEIVRSGARRLAPLRVHRVPRFNPRSDSAGPALPPPAAAAVFGGGQPVVGGTIIAAFDGTQLDPVERVEAVVMDGERALARAALDLGRMR